MAPARRRPSLTRRAGAGGQSAVAGSRPTLTRFPQAVAGSRPALARPRPGLTPAAGAWSALAGPRSAIAGPRPQSALTHPAGAGGRPDLACPIRAAGRGRGLAGDPAGVDQRMVTADERANHAR